MLWMLSGDATAVDLWTNVSDAAVVWFASVTGPNDAAEVACRAVRQGVMRTFASTDPETIRRLRAATSRLPWIAVQSPRDRWEKFVHLDRVSEVRRLPASPASPDPPQKLLLSITYDNGTQPVTETVGEVFDPAAIDRILGRLARMPKGA